MIGRRTKLFIAAAAVSVCAILGAALLVRAFETNQSARVVVGHDFFTEESAAGVKANNLGLWPFSVYSDGSKLYLSDRGHHRVMIFNTIPTTDFENADVFVGQEDGSKGTADRSGAGLGANSLDTPYGVFATDSKLFIADTNNHRVLIYDPIPTTQLEADLGADIVIGQSSFTSNSFGANPDQLRSPYGVWATATTLFVADTLNNRVLIYTDIDSLPTTGAIADYAIGQVNTSSNTDDGNGVSESGRTLDGPSFVSTDGTRLYVADRDNNRVMIYDPPYVTNATASFVIGDVDFSKGAGGASAVTVQSPYGVHSYDGSLYIGDYSNNRILVYKDVPTNQDEANAGADFAIGQDDLVSNTSQRDLARGQDGFFQPTNVIAAFTGATNSLFIADRGNHRIVIHNAAPHNQTQADDGADVLVGQYLWTAATLNATRVGGDSFDTPMYTYTDGTKMYVADSSNHRVLIYNSVPTTSGASASVIIGQYTFDGTTANRGILNTPVAASSTLDYPTCVYATGGKMFVADYNNHRVLIYDPVPTTTGASASLVIGQTTANVNSIDANQGGGAGANTLQNPFSVFVDVNGKLFISDYGNHRVLIFNTVPTINDASANVVVGQAGMGSNTANQGGGVAANTLNFPRGVHSDGNKLFIADGTNHRVLIYDAIPAADDASANKVVGQADMGSNTADQGGAAASNTLDLPYDVYCDGPSLFVSDYNNNRVLIWDSVPTAAADAPATKVLGQQDFTSTTADQGDALPDADTLENPASVFSDGTKLFVSDQLNHRALLYYPYQETGSIIFID